MIGLHGAAVASAIEVRPGAKRIQLFPGYGTWRGRNGLGPYTIEDKAQAEQIIATTYAAQGPTDLMFDYDHQAVLAPAVGGRAIAAGWFRALSADDTGIWAENVQWTAAAAAQIAAREYRYASPYFLHDKAGRVTRIVNAGLTNTPNFDMQAVAASAALVIPEYVNAPQLTRDEIDISARLGLSADAFIAAKAEMEAVASDMLPPVLAQGDAITDDERAIAWRLSLSDQSFIAARNAPT